MTEQYHVPYPEAEEYHFPKSEVEVLRDELRHANSPEDFRLSVTGLTRQYSNTSLMYGFKKYALLSNVSKVQAGETAMEGKPQIDADFYAGEVMAVHSIIKTQDHFTRRRAWNQDFLSSYTPGANLTEEKHQMLDQLVDILTRQRNNIYEELEELPEEVQEALIDVAGGMYHSHEQARQDDFAAGYLFARSTLHYAMEIGVI